MDVGLVFQASVEGSLWDGECQHSERRGVLARVMGLAFVEAALESGQTVGKLVLLP